jgi:uncharacterized Zn finger protein
MKCPNCGNRDAVVIDTHSEGYTSEEFPVKECGACGLVWCLKRKDDKNVVDIIKPASKTP